MKCKCRHDESIHNNICTFSELGECSASGCLCTEYRPTGRFNKLGGVEADYK